MYDQEQIQTRVCPELVDNKEYILLRVGISREEERVKNEDTGVGYGIERMYLNIGL